MALSYKRIIIKIGSNVLTKENGLPDFERMAHLVEQISELKRQGKEIILVSSGAVASGRGLVSVSDKNDAVATRQLFAAIGQVKLINKYSELFEIYNLVCAQVLVTKEDFRDRLHYLNMKNCFHILLQHNVIPVINENDVISVTELMFTDNDELAGLIASMLNADALFILSNVDGIYNGDPRDVKSEVIREVTTSIAGFSSFIVAGKSQFGRGGMFTKANMALKVAQLGISVHVGNGKKDNIILDIISKKAVHTHFVPQKNASEKKKWLAHSENYAKGKVEINDGAKMALTSDKANSLLPVGLIKVKEAFQKGDIIKIVDSAGKQIGLGIAEYGSDKAEEKIGQKKQRPLVHYDYLFLNPE